MRALWKSSSATVIEPDPSMFERMLAPCSAEVIAALSASLTLANRIRCGGVETSDQARKPAATRPIRKSSGMARRTAGCASSPRIWASGAPSRPVADGMAASVEVRALLMGYTGMLMMSL